MIRFNVRALLISLFLFLLLVLMALYVKDRIVRPFFGDTLAVIWLYYTMRAVVNISPFRLSIVVLAIAFCVEFAQYFNVVELLGMQDIKVAKIILGSTFDVMDLLAYSVGWLIIVAITAYSSSRRPSGLESA